MKEKGRFVLIVWCFVGVRGAALDTWGTADMQVVFFPRTSCVSHVFLEGKKIFVEEASCGRFKRKRSVYDVAREQVLAGYRFLREISEDARKDAALWEDGVREFICKREAFFSQDLRKCFQAIEEALLTGKHVVRVLTKCSWKHPLEARAIEDIYPEDKTRKWSVIAPQDVWTADSIGTVCLVFRKEIAVLRGSLCWKCEEKGESQEHSLLDYKRFNPLDGRSVCCKKWFVTIPTALNLLDPNCVSLYDIGILCAFPNSPWRWGLFDGSDIAFQASYAWCRRFCCEQTTLTQAVRREFMRGFMLNYINDVCGRRFWNNALCAHKNVKVLNSPGVREVACEKRQFISKILGAVLHKLVTLWETPGVRAQGGSDYDVLHKKHVQELQEPYMQFMWEVLDKKALQAKLRSPAKVKTVLLLVHGENVALSGTLISQCRNISAAGTLWEYAVRDLLEKRQSRVDVL